MARCSTLDGGVRYGKRKLDWNHIQGTNYCDDGQCKACSGGVNGMTLKNNGPTAAITVTNGSKTFFNGTVESGENFFFQAPNNHNDDKRTATFGAQLTITANGKVTTIDTSCGTRGGCQLRGR